MNALKHKLSFWKKAPRNLAAAFFLLAPASPGVSAASNESFFSSKAVGTTSADFLNLSVGARAAAMGGAYSAVSDEASAIYWNPAGLVQIPKASAILMRTQYVQDISYQYAAYAHRLSYDSVLAGSIFMTDIGEINRTDVNNTDLGKFSPSDQVFSLAYSKGILELSDKDLDVAIGLSVKYINSEILDSARSFAGDIGLMTYNFGKVPYRLAVTASNFGGGLRYDVKSSPLPLTLKLGGAVNPFRNLMLAADVVFPKQNKPNLLIGAELGTNPGEFTRLCLRAGLNAKQLEDGLGGYSLGAGATMRSFSLDYAFVPMGELGTTHRISITLDFPFRTHIFQRRDRSIFARTKSSSYK